MTRQNLLGRDILVRALVTVDRERGVRCAMATVDATTPPRQVVESFLLAAHRFAAEAERLAAQHGLELVVTPDGEVTVCG